MIVEIIISFLWFSVNINKILHLKNRDDRLFQTIDMRFGLVGPHQYGAEFHMNRKILSLEPGSHR